MKRLWHGRWGEAAPGLAGLPSAGWASAAAATHVVVMEQVISILILVVLNHSH
jgi:hypothetical protein